MTKLACATVSAEGMDDSGFARTFSLVPAAGFRFVEFNLWFARWITDEAAHDLRSRCREANLAVAATYGRGVGRDQSDVDLAHKIRVMDVASRLNSSRVVFGGVPGRDSQAFEKGIETLRLLAPIAADRGLSVAIENHANFTFESIEDYEAMFNEISSPAVGLCIDTGHFEAAGIRLSDVVDRLGDRVNHIHVKENRTFGEKSFCRFGEGTTDNLSLVSTMVDRGFSGFVTVEISPQPDRPTNVDDLRKAYEMFARFDTKKPGEEE
jgi:sugar phosphate isomerase/epimerase